METLIDYLRLALRNAKPYVIAGTPAKLSDSRLNNEYWQFYFIFQIVGLIVVSHVDAWMFIRSLYMYHVGQTEGTISK